MAVYKLFPSQDASIYSFYPNMNTGIDPMVELGSINLHTNPVPQVFRGLIQFDDDEINEVISKIGNDSFQVKLKLYCAEAQGIIFDTYVEIAPLSEPWNNGNGTYLDSPFTTNGVSWVYTTYENGDEWPTDNYDPYVTGSYSLDDTFGGGSWFTGSDDINNPNVLITSSYSPRSYKDLYVDVTDIVKIWNTSSLSISSPFIDIPNNGFIVKFESLVEFSMQSAVQPILQMYGVDTNSIYPPTLDFKWDDQVYSSSLEEINTEELYISLDNNPGTYYPDSVNRFRLNVRPKYPIKTYQTSSVYTNNYKLNANSVYAVKDLDTNEFVIDFDENSTKISADDRSNYFDIYMNGLQPERNYSILVKTEISGSTIVEDCKYTFKVING